MEYVSSENDRQLLVKYAGEFSDGTPRGWEFRQAGDVWDITFPNKAQLQSTELLISNFWASVPSKDANTTVLWRNSLAYLPRMIQIDAGQRSINVAERIVESFLQWFEEAAANDINQLKSGSQDHQSALRIRTMLWILSFLTRGERAEEFDRFMTLYKRLLLIENRLLNELDLYQPNNHGIMLGIAHLHTATLLPGLLPGDDADTWVSRLYSTLGEIIDEDGIASENTPIYQVFYVMLLEDVVAFVNWSGKFSGRARMFQLLLRAAQIGFRKQLLPTGAVPPLGDSPGGMQYKYKPMLGELWSPNNGLAVISRENEYLSFVSGFRSVIHKQLDDLSVSWWRDGEFIFRDAGLLSYDQNDPVAVAMRGPKGHSLATYTAFDSWTTKNSISYGQNSSRLRGLLVGKETNNRESRLTAILRYDEKTILERTVKLDGELGFSVTDRFEATRYGDPMVRFLLDPSIVVQQESDGSIVLVRNGLKISGTFCASDQNSKLEVTVSDGQIAMEHNEAKTTKQIVVSVPNCSSIIEIASTFTISKEIGE